MIDESRRILKAKEYQIVEINKYKHMIKPIGEETEDVMINRDEIVMDFITLISEYSKCKQLREYPFPQTYEGLTEKRDQNKTANLNKHIFEQKELMSDALMTFINKYGLFGIMNDEIITYDFNRKENDGTFSNSKYPANVTVNIERDHYTEQRIIPYKEYIKPYFPDVPANEAIRLEGAANARHYCECIEDILQNKRIKACTNYIAGIDKQNKGTLIIQGLNAALSFKNGVPEFDIQYRSLIEYCHSMLFLNEIAGENKQVQICQYRRCRRPFIGKKAKYCCDACMRNANKGKKREGQKNG